jgi:hypothetical protein
MRAKTLARLGVPVASGKLGCCLACLATSGLSPLQRRHLRTPLSSCKVSCRFPSLDNTASMWSVCSLKCRRKWTEGKCAPPCPAYASMSAQHAVGPSSVLHCRLWPTVTSLGRPDARAQHSSHHAKCSISRASWLSPCLSRLQLQAQGLKVVESPRISICLSSPTPS